MSRKPSGAYAANVLGLSEQVPSRIVFLTDGPARKVKIGKREILLQHTTPRNMATAGRKSGTLIQALRYLGQDQVDERVLANLRRYIADADRPAIRAHDLPESREHHRSTHLVSFPRQGTVEHSRHHQKIHLDRCCGTQTERIPTSPTDF